MCIRDRRQAAANAARGVDDGGNPVVGGAQNPAPVFGGAHAYDVQVLPARGALAEPTIVGEIEQRFRASGREFADEPGEDRFVTDESADPVLPDLRYHHAMARLEVAHFAGNFIRQVVERPRNKFAERHQVYLVITLSLIHI